MGFRREIDHVVKIILFKESCHQVFVADIALHKDVPGIVFYAFEVFQVSGIGERVKIDQENVLILLQHVIHEI